MASPKSLGAMTPYIFTTVPLDDDRCLVKLDIYGVRLETILVVGLSTDSPHVSWPCTSRGYPVVRIAHDETRKQIEAIILDAALKATPAGWGVEKKRRAQRA